MVANSELESIHTKKNERELSMKKKNGIIFSLGAIVVLLLVLGYQALIIDNLKREITVLRDQNNAYQSDMEDMWMNTIHVTSDVSLFSLENDDERMIDLPDPAPVDMIKPKQSRFQDMKDMVLWFFSKKSALPVRNNKASNTKVLTSIDADHTAHEVASMKEIREYCGQLNAFIQPRWNAVAPSNNELGGIIFKWPVIELTINQKGEVIKAIFVSQSGNKTIDDAVKALLTDLKVVPVPPQTAAIRITLEIR